MEPQSTATGDEHTGTTPENAPTPRSEERRFVRARPRIMSGVCSGMARATNTDPILWRVLLAVLVFFGGIGVLLYLLGWLLLPSEEDTGSPAEALLGRGTSNTSPTSTVLLGALTIGVCAFALNVGFSAVALLAIGILIVGLLLRRDGVTFPSAPSHATEQHANTPQWTPPPTTRMPSGGGFAPHGPYTNTQATAPPPKPRARKPAKASLITIGTLFCGLAGLVVADGTGSNIPAGLYAVTALGIISAGMVIGSFFGRARGLIALGIIGTLMLGITQAVSVLDDRINDREHSVTITDAANLQDHYEHRFGRFKLNLSAIKLDQSHAINVEHGVGELVIIVPKDVDVEVELNVGVGDAHVFGQHEDGFDISRTFINQADNTDTTMTLNIDMGVGDVEVTQ